jgi:antitoxin component of RelBE/YafQ-DinJ toxin-antitoxin module
MPRGQKPTQTILSCSINKKVKEDFTKKVKSSGMKINFVIEKLLAKYLAGENDI